jgi:TolB-like protein/Flp pilus assembly protein TadD
MDSWKEIAVYLNRDVRTVQRWEKREGLPVHRHQHDRLGSIFAYKEEIDRWWEERSTSPAVDTVISEEPEAAEGLPVPTEAAVAPAEVSTPEQAAPQPAEKNYKLAYLALAVGVLIVAALAFWYSKHNNAVGAKSTFTVAVLPFANLSEDNAQEYLSDGITEELSTQLGRLHSTQLRVISAGSSLTYKKTSKTLKQIARELGVNYLVQGSVRRAGDRVRISAHLLRAEDESHVWDESYDRSEKDLISLQVEVAEAIARGINVTLSARPQSFPAANAQAYEAYLKGRYLWNKRTPEDLNRAIGFFRQATALDPKYAPAYVGIADCYALLGSAELGAIPPKQAMPLAREAANKALTLAPEFAEAHASYAHIKLVYEWDFAGAEQEFERALTLNPGYATAHQWHALLLNSLGRHTEAIAEIREAQKLDPISPANRTALAEAYYFAHDYEAALHESRNALELSPDFILARVNLGRAYERLGRYDDAISEFQKASATSGGAPALLALVAHAYATKGDKKQALELVKTIGQTQQKGAYVSPLYLAAIYAALHDTDTAIKQLQSAVEERCEYVIYLNQEPMAEQVKHDPRFEGIKKSISLQ